ncbi:hypothetical protein D9M68_309050 [compost metagenome]
MHSSGGMTARIDRRERDGLVVRRSHPTDRRGTLVALTPKGISLIDAMLAKHVENERFALAGLTMTEQQQLNALSIKLLAGLKAQDGLRPYLGQDHSSTVSVSCHRGREANSPTRENVFDQLQTQTPMGRAGSVLEQHSLRQGRDHWEVLLRARRNADISSGRRPNRAPTLREESSAGDTP